MQEIIKKVKVDRNKTFEELLNSMDITKYVDNDVVNSAPKGEGDVVEIVLFKIGSYISDDNLEKEYEKRGLKPVDPVSLATLNEADPDFVTDNPNTTHWKDAQGNWCSATFNRWRGGRGVFVSRSDGGWGGGWSFAGVRKPLELKDKNSLETSSLELPQEITLNGIIYVRK